MRIYLKREVLKLLQTLHEAHKVLNRLSERGEKEKEYQCLTELQEAAIATGNFLEEAEEEHQEMISVLEEYCEDVYVYSKEEDLRLKKDICKKMEERLRLLEEKLLYEVKNDRLEVVFLPYKADMWTSLSSVYEAAKADEECRVRVIPIPYYDIADADNIQLKQEAERFPKDVELTDYRQYDLEKHHPDMIFIHNPYDGCNNLTRVPQCYYSDNLKKHSEMLIYSPYFTVGTYRPGTQDFMFAMPGVYHADYIISQSERVKRLFERYGHESKKILTFGSPKIDAVIQNEHRKREIPKAWKQKLEGKKVFLLNTHLSYFPKALNYAKSMDNYAVKFHREMEKVFLNKEDCALIWRPHPLLKNMLAGRFPECLPFVKEFEEKVREAENGIVDESGDYFDAFYCSDALLSTWSSLINEYMVTGKPVFIFQKPMEEETVRNSPLNRNMNYFRLGKNKMSFQTFHDNVVSGKDSMREERMKAVWEAFPNRDGRAGEKIYQYLKHTF